jgi:hypothetical protein
LFALVASSSSAVSLYAQAPADETGKLRKLLADDWEFRMKESPTWASTLGDRRWNDRWGDVGEPAVRRRDEHRAAVLAALAAIDRAALPPAERLNPRPLPPGDGDRATGPPLQPAPGRAQPARRGSDSARIGRFAPL